MEIAVKLIEDGQVMDSNYKCEETNIGLHQKCYKTLKADEWMRIQIYGCPRPGMVELHVVHHCARKPTPIAIRSVNFIKLEFQGRFSAKF